MGGNNNAPQLSRRQFLRAAAKGLAGIVVASVPVLSGCESAPLGSYGSLTPYYEGLITDDYGDTFRVVYRRGEGVYPSVIELYIPDTGVLSERIVNYEPRKGLHGNIIGDDPKDSYMPYPNGPVIHKSRVIYDGITYRRGDPTTKNLFTKVDKRLQEATRRYQYFINKISEDLGNIL